MLYPTAHGLPCYSSIVIVDVIGQWSVTLAQITTGDLDVAVIAQLSSAQLPLGYLLEPGAVEMVALNALLRRRGRQQMLEDTTRDADNALVFADLNAEFHGLPIGVPPGVFGKCEKHDAPSLGQI
jgi:hypothetical protein